MANLKTYLDEIVDYSDIIVKNLSKNQKIVGLLIDNPDVDIVNNEINVINSQIYNYNYIPDIQKDSLSYITIDTVVNKSKTDAIKTMGLIITIISHKNNMKLNNDVFKGLKGNRRDNLIRYVDKLIRDNDKLGIGKIQLHSNNPIRSVYVGSNNYTAKEIIYDIVDFNRRT